MPEFDFTSVAALIASRAEELVGRTSAGEFSQASCDARLDELTVVQARLHEEARRYVRALSDDVREVGP